jgi:hypothetical protein
MRCTSANLSLAADVCVSSSLLREISKREVRSLIIESELAGLLISIVTSYYAHAQPNMDDRYFGDRSFNVPERFGSGLIMRTVPMVACPACYTAADLCSLSSLMQLAVLTGNDQLDKLPNLVHTWNTVRATFFSRLSIPF